MSVSVLDVLTRARLQLMDDTGIRWTDDELVAYVNDAQREIVLYKPDAVTRNENLALVLGTKQSLPAESIRLLTVVRNNSSTNKRSIRPVPRETLDRFKPDWHGETAVAEVQHFIFDDTDQKHFYVYPPNNGDGEVEILYTKHPDTVTASDNLEVADGYANTILDYVLYRAFSKDADIPSSSQRANVYYQGFMNSISGKGQIDALVSPQVEPQAQP